MKDERCVEFLQWALPRLDMRWEGFRKVQDQVCKRIDRRMEELAVSDIDAYRRRLVEDPEEWSVLDGFCRITIFRFRRDRKVWTYLHEVVLPDILSGITSNGSNGNDKDLRVWSAGCGAGEEPYTLAILWKLELEDRYPGIALHIVATDAEPAVLDRARRARYQPATLEELPDSWIDAAFDEVSSPPSRDPEDTMELRSTFREPVELVEQDIREEMPTGRFHLVFCRNLAFTYFAEELQVEVLEKILDRMEPGGALVIGGHEELPPGEWSLEKPHRSHPVYRATVTRHH